MTTRSSGGAVFAGAAAGSAAGNLLAEALKSKPANAAGTFSLDAATIALIQKLANNSDSANGALSALGIQLANILAALSGAASTRRADKFGLDNQTIPAGKSLSILSEGSGKGSLVWFLLDIQNPAIVLSIILDNIQYDFDMTQMILEGLMTPMYPGAWITKADPIGPPPTYAMMFSVGNLDGYAYNQRIEVSVQNNAATPVVLNHSTGIKWITS